MRLDTVQRVTWRARFPGGEVRGVACCFCGESVQHGDIDPVSIAVTARSDREDRASQTLWCHSSCLSATGMSDLHVTRPEFWERPDE